TCIATDGGGKAVIFDFTDQNRNYKLQSKPIEALLFLPNSTKIVQTFAKGTIRFSDPYSIHTMASIGGLDKSVKRKLASGNDKLYVASDNGNLLVVGVKLPVVQNKIKLFKPSITALCVDTDARVIVAASADGQIKVIDISTLEILETYKGKINRLSDICFSSDGAEIYTAFQNGELKYFNLETLETFSCQELLKNKKVSRRETELLKLEISNDEVWITFAKKLRSVEIKTRYDYVHQYKAKWDVADNKLTDISRVKKGYFEGLYERGLLSNEVVLDGDRNPIYTTNLSYNGKEAYYSTESNLVFFDAASYSLSHDDAISAIEYIPKANLLVSGSWDGSIRFWDPKTGQLRNKLYLFDEDQFTIFNAENEYFSSKDGIRNIGFRYNNQLFSFEQFDLLYNRPDKVFVNLKDIVGDQLVENYQLAFKKRLSRLGITKDQLSISENIPEFQMEVPNATDQLATLNLNWSTAINEKAKLHVYVNGVPEFGANGLAVGSSSTDSLVNIKLEAGQNNISAYISTESGVKSLRRERTLLSAEKTVSGNLFLITIGCSEYQQSDFNLNYAAKDAQDISTFFEQNKAYKNVNTKTFTNEKVNRGMLDEIEVFISSAQISDVVMIYIAGHGVLSSDLDFYLASYDLDFQNPEGRGIAYEAVEQVLENCASRHKCLFLDACHSGEIDKESAELAISNAETEDGEIKFRAVGNSIVSTGQNSFQLSKNLFADMRPNHGINIISSAGGAEYAMEGAKWQNGVFTYAFLDGISSGKADMNDDGNIELSEIKEYVLKSVVKMTNGAQNPTSRIENLYNDFTIYK
ncbi:MAG: WD40 repeat protein/uncharacterized caspase-like protein, partial [Parvicella sp.]